MVEVCACGTVAVPKIVVEGVGLLAAGVIVQDDSRAGRRGIALVCLHELRMVPYELRYSVIYTVYVRNRKMRYCLEYEKCS